MNSTLSPREIQARIRGGATLAEVAAEAGVDESDLEGFAGPVLAEREFIAHTALEATIRRRGETSHRRLGDLIRERLQVRAIDADEIDWDAWRQEDLRWRVVGVLADDAGTRTAEFVFDHKARFSVADNADARWMIGEEPMDPGHEDENTVDFDDELALVRATKEDRRQALDYPGDDVPVAGAMHDDFEDTSELDALYDMLSGISEDSVRIYTGLAGEGDATAPSPTQRSDEPAPEHQHDAEPAAVGDATVCDAEKQDDDTPAHTDEAGEEPVQDSLIDDGQPPARRAPRKRRGRASVPSWDEIMFGGPTR